MHRCSWDRPLCAHFCHTWVREARWAWALPCRGRPSTAVCIASTCTPGRRPMAVRCSRRGAFFALKKRGKRVEGRPKVYNKTRQLCKPVKKRLMLPWFTRMIDGEGKRLKAGAELPDDFLLIVIVICTYAYIYVLCTCIRIVNCYSMLVI